MTYKNLQGKIPLNKVHLAKYSKEYITVVNYAFALENIEASLLFSKIYLYSITRCRVITYLKCPINLNGIRDILKRVLLNKKERKENHCNVVKNLPEFKVQMRKLH